MKITYLLSALLLALTTSFTSCKSDTSSAANDTAAPFEMAKAAYEKEDNAANAKAYIENIRKAVVNGEGDKKALLETGLEIAEKYKMGPTAVSFFMPLIKDYQDANTPEHIAKLASALKDLGRDNAAEIMTQSYLSQAPEGKFAELLKTKVGSDLSDPGRIRTLNPQSRNLIFYPVELRSHYLAQI